MCIKQVFIKALAERNYQQRIKKEEGPLDDWLKAEKEVERVFAGILYLAIGFFFLYRYKLTPSFIHLPGQNDAFISLIISTIKSPALLWCLGWSSIGIGAGLINTRNHSYGCWAMQHICYCGFVLICVSIISFTASLYWSGVINIKDNATSAFVPLNIIGLLRFLSLSSVISLLGGFLVDSLHPLAKAFVGKGKENVI